jgi:hypothetical protein
MEPGILCARPLVSHATAQILDGHPVSGNMVVDDRIGHIADEQPLLPQFAIQTCLAIANPNVPNCLRVKATYLEQQVTIDSHVDPKETAFGIQAKFSVRFHDAEINKGFGTAYEFH